jgi:hypothetical protein
MGRSKAHNLIIQQPLQFLPPDGFFLVVELEEISRQGLSGWLVLWVVV